MKKLLLFSWVMGCAFISRAQTITQDHPNITQERLQAKNFYLFSVLESNAGIMNLLKTDKQLKSYWDKMTIPMETLPQNGKEIITPFLWSESDIQTIGNRLVDLS